MRLAIGIAAAVAALGLAGPVAAQSEEVQKALEDANRRFVEAFNSGDVEEAVRGIYTEDAVLLPPNTQRIEGRDEIVRFWQDTAETGINSVELETVQVEAADSLAYEIGEFALGGAEDAQTGAPLALEGKYVVVWKSTDDGWKWHVDIWNMNPPLQ